MIIDHVRLCRCDSPVIEGGERGKRIDARCVAAYVTPGESEPAGESVNDGDPWADVMPAPLCAHDCDHAEHQPNPVLAPQFHPVSEIDAERISRGGFNPYTEPEWQAAAAPLTPIEGN
jgi:hypothetical protein